MSRHRIHFSNHNTTRADTRDGHERIEIERVAAMEMNRVLSDGSQIALPGRFLLLGSRNEILIATVIRFEYRDTEVHEIVDPAEVVLVVMRVHEHVDLTHTSLLH